MYQRNLDFLQPIEANDLIRLGRKEDGGYVVPQCAIDQSNILLSLGIGDEFSFEQAYAKRTGAYVIGVDHTVRFERLCLNAIGQLAAGLLAGCHGKKLDAAFLMHYLKAPWEYQRFFKSGPHQMRGQRIWHYSDQGNIRLDDLINIYTQDNKHQLFLKMDIEGSEYRALPQILEHISDYADRLTGMVIEFHELDLHWERFRQTIVALKQNFYIAHVHGNNCADLIPGTEIPMTWEITLVNKDLHQIEPRPSQWAYPIAGLDHPNDPRKADYTLNFSTDIMRGQVFTLSAGSNIGRSIVPH